MAGTCEFSPLPRGALGNARGAVLGWLVSSWFGSRIDPFTGRPGGHGGMDFPAPTGTPMIAVNPGQVFHFWDVTGGGQWSRLVCDNGDEWGYGHASAFGGPSGRRVNAGDVIAFVGSTGASTGPHLHIAYRPRGAASYADPYPALLTATRYAGDAPVPAELPTVPKPSTTTTTKELGVHTPTIYEVETIPGPQYLLDHHERIVTTITPDAAETLVQHEGAIYVTVPAGGATHRLIAEEYHPAPEPAGRG